MGTKISDFTAASALDGTEIVPVLQGGADKQTTVAAIAAKAAGGGAPAPYATVVSGSYYGPGVPVPFFYTGTASLAITTATLYAFPFSVPKAMTTDRIGFGSATGSGGGGVKFGIYAADATTGLPSTLVQAITVTTALNNSGGPHYGAFTQALSANTLYWIAFISQSAGSIPLMSAQYTLGYDSGSSVYCGVTGSSTYATGLPSSFGTATKITLSVSSGSITQNGPFNIYVRSV